MVQASGGYTLTIQPFYADANSVVVSMTVQGITLNPNEIPYLGWREGETTHPLQLTDAEGHDFPLLLARPDPRAVGYRDLERRHELFYLLVFDTGAFHAAPTTLSLHLTVGVGVMVFRNIKGETGPLNFAFVLPYDPALQITEVNQTVGNHKGSLTLDRLTVSHHSVRAGWHFNLLPGGITLPSSIPDEFYLPNSLSLQVGDWSSASAPPAFVAVGGKPEAWTSQLLTLPPKQSGDWTLQTQGDVVERNGVGNYGQWVYHFTVPPAGEPPLVYTPVTIQISPTPLPTSPSTPTWSPPTPFVPAIPRPIPTSNLPSPIPSLAP